METDGFDDILPGCDVLKKRVLGWKSYEERYHNAEEDEEDCADFSELSEDVENDVEESDNEDRALSENFEEVQENTALVSFWEPRSVYEDCLMPLIQRRNDSWFEQMKKMDFHSKVSDWLQSNAAKMGNAFRDASNFRGRFRMSNFNSTEIEMDNTNDSATSVDTAAYIMANRNRNFSKSRMRMVTVKEYCFLEQDTDLLRFDKQPQWPPVAITRHVSPSMSPSSRCIVKSNRQKRPIDHAKPLQKKKNTSPRRKSRRSARKSKRCYLNDCCSGSETESECDDPKKDKGPMVNNESKVFITPVRKKPESPKKTESPKNPDEIIIYQPDDASATAKTVKITMEMLEEKLGKKIAESLKDDNFLKFPVTAYSTVVYNRPNKSLMEYMGDKKPQKEKKQNEKKIEQKIATMIRNQTPKRSVKQIVIYEPSKDKLKSKANIRITQEMLRGKVDEDTIMSLIQSPFFKFPFPESATLLYNPRTQQLYEPL
ncbi:uncharacterized protein LOC132262105 [Phlebotomus argentipes]|uniref:uncharacterized protein LOC132262105 n=1 Tax=Phlebotomus argentipes TaxID=94469 RepID=UPI002892ACAB|nr:uncharacterized protein LOC132262105 [Phlebotomus argentipes]